MTLENKIGIDNSAELANVEKKISKTKAIELFEKCILNSLECGTFASLIAIHNISLMKFIILREKSEP